MKTQQRKSDQRARRTRAGRASQQEAGRAQPRPHAPTPQRQPPLWLGSLTLCASGGSASGTPCPSTPWSPPPATAPPERPRRGARATERSRFSPSRGQDCLALSSRRLSLFSRARVSFVVSCEFVSPSSPHCSLTDSMNPASRSRVQSVASLSSVVSRHSLVSLFTFSLALALIASLLGSHAAPHTQRALHSATCWPVLVCVRVPWACARRVFVSAVCACVRVRVRARVRVCVCARVRVYAGVAARAGAVRLQVRDIPRRLLMQR